MSSCDLVSETIEIESVSDSSALIPEHFSVSLNQFDYDEKKRLPTGPEWLFAADLCIQDLHARRRNGIIHFGTKITGKIKDSVTEAAFTKLGSRVPCYRAMWTHLINRLLSFATEKQV